MGYDPKDAFRLGNLTTYTRSAGFKRHVNSFVAFTPTAAL